MYHILHLLSIPTTLCYFHPCQRSSSQVTAMTSSVTQGEGIIRSLPVDLIASKTDLTIICKSSVFSTIDTTKIYIIITSPNKLKKKIPNVILTLKTPHFRRQKDKKESPHSTLLRALGKKNREVRDSLFLTKFPSSNRMDSFKNSSSDRLRLAVHIQGR